MKSTDTSECELNGNPFSINVDRLANSLPIIDTQLVEIDVYQNEQVIVYNNQNIHRCIVHVCNQKQFNTIYLLTQLGSYTQLLNYLDASEVTNGYIVDIRYFTSSANGMTVFDKLREDWSDKKSMYFATYYFPVLYNNMKWKRRF